MIKNNLFRSSSHQDDPEHDFHDDAFQMMDTNSTNPERGWPGDSRSGSGMVDRGNMNDEMMDTMALFNGQLDDVECGYDNDIFLDTDPVLLDGIASDDPVIYDVVEVDVLMAVDDDGQNDQPYEGASAGVGSDTRCR